MAAFIYRTKDNDMLDALCHKHYGRSDVVPQVLEANPGLADLGPVFEAGIEILLPEITTPAAPDQVRLWD